MKQGRRMTIGGSRAFAALACVVIVCFAGWQAAVAVDRYVANNGVDNLVCDQVSPCRSINRAIAVAQPGNTIVVGPGIYGFGEDGNESPAVGCSCMVYVGKPLRIVSLMGAASTVIDARGHAVLTVLISTNDVVFGEVGHGFLITGASAGGNGLVVAGTDNVASGNIARGNNAGIVTSGSNITISHNLSIANTAAGFALFGTGNKATFNAAAANGSEGLLVLGTNHVLSHNSASGNFFGIGVQGTDMEIVGNSTIGNRNAGIYVSSSSSASIHGNNIYGNDNTFSGNCGISNQSGLPIDATDNYWGTSTGPGANPADNECDASGAMSVFPFAPRQFPATGPTVF